jgi:hypothetical protein
METSKDASEIVTIDSSQCGSASSESKPEWEGDRAISLPWMDEIYKEWESSDFSGGEPDVDYAIITVSSYSALSKESKVLLTGNPDCCTPSGCEGECWMNPATIKYNGNRPMTDFVFAMPCVEETYYEACEDATPRYVKVSGKSDAPQIRVGNSCYTQSFKNDQAVEVKNWQRAVDCEEECEPEYEFEKPDEIDQGGATNFSQECGPIKTGGECGDTGCDLVYDTPAEVSFRICYELGDYDFKTPHCTGVRRCGWFEEEVPVGGSYNCVYQSHPKIAECNHAEDSCLVECVETAISCGESCDPGALIISWECHEPCGIDMCDCFMGCLKEYSTCCC